MKKLKAWLGEDYHDYSKNIGDATDADLVHMSNVHDERWAVFSSMEIILDGLRRNLYEMAEKMKLCSNEKWRAASVYAKANRKDKLYFKKVLKLARELSKLEDEWMAERHEFEMATYGKTMTRFHED